VKEKQRDHRGRRYRRGRRGAAQQLGLTVAWQAHQVEGAWKGKSAAAIGSVPSGAKRSAVTLRGRATTALAEK
jgi:hypothetical protein